MEVEIKFRVTDPAALSDKLLAIGFKLKTKATHEMNSLYDRPDGSLRRKGHLLRIRKYGQVWMLTQKGPAASGRHKTRNEIETSVEDGEKLAAIFATLGYVVTFRYEKVRTEWTDVTGHVVLDETPIGDFGEIEGPPEWIDSIAGKLGVQLSQYLTQSYAALFFEWKAATGCNAKEMTWEAVREK